MMQVSIRTGIRPNVFATRKASAKMRNSTLFSTRLIVMIAFSILGITGCRASNTCPTADDYLELSNLNQSDLQLRIDEYSESIEVERDNADLFVARGMAYDQQGDYETAISDYDQAIDLDRG